MKNFFIELFEYHHTVNQELADLLEQHQQKLPERAFILFAHIIKAQHLWNNRILGERGSIKDIFEFESIEHCRTMDVENLRQTTEIINKEEHIGRIIEYHTIKGVPYTSSIQDILFHVINHHTHHKGQIISMIRESGVEPLKTDYIFFKRESNGR